MASIIDGIYCAQCNLEMKKGIISHYEYEEGYPLHNVDAYKCPQCNKTFFTEEQAHQMESRTERMKKELFGFERTVSVSGKSLVVGIPSALADHFHIRKGQKVKIIPSDKGFMIKVHA